jgi:hypothetical protein
MHTTSSSTVESVQLYIGASHDEGVVANMGRRILQTRAQSLMIKEGGDTRALKGVVGKLRMERRLECISTQKEAVTKQQKGRLHAVSALCVHFC